MKVIEGFLRRKLTPEEEALKKKLEPLRKKLWENYLSYYRVLQDGLQYPGSKMQQRMEDYGVDIDEWDLEKWKRKFPDDFTEIANETYENGKMVWSKFTSQLRHHLILVKPVKKILKENIELLKTIKDRTKGVRGKLFDWNPLDDCVMFVKREISVKQIIRMGHKEFIRRVLATANFLPKKPTKKDWLYVVDVPDGQIGILSDHEHNHIMYNY